MVALLLGLWAGISMVLNLSGLGIRTAIISGVVAGALVGDVGLGFEIGATCLLMSIGFYTYGGATIPDWITAAMIGTVVAKDSGYENGMAIATLLALLMTQMDILGRASTTVFQHLGDKALADNNIGKFEMWTLAGTIPWTLSRFLPVFLAVMMKDQVKVITDFAAQFAWFSNGLAVVGKALPAVGFALLLSYMNLKKFWPFMVVGYVLYAYMGVGTIGLALVGAAAGALYMGQKGGAQ